MKTYRSRISITMLVIIFAICLFPVLFEHEIGFLITDATVFVLIVSSFFSIKYVIDGQTLKIYYFWGVHQDIDIMTIKKMEPSHSILSSPAASLKRLAIYYNKYDVIYISPRNQEDFINQINCYINSNGKK